MSARSRFFAVALILGTMPAAVAAPLEASSTPIDPTALSETVKTLASDDFEGRAPGTEGEARTVRYLVERLKALGLAPVGDGGGWTQAVPLVHTELSAPPRIDIAGPGLRPIELEQGRQIEVNTLTPSEKIEVKGARLVFVGYGVSAPERGWDDFKGVDLKGKIAVFLVNDPDFEALPGDPAYGRFAGRAMTYYGRWTYKFEEAARRGAAGALIVHEPDGAGYGWQTVAASHGEAYDVARPAGSPQPVPLQGWLARDAALALFSRAGLDFEKLKTSARSTEFQPVPLGDLVLNADLSVRVSSVESHNVLAKLDGTTHPDESIIYGAHWDAYGVGAPDVHGDKIRRGANDDGLGVAGVIEIARAFAAAPRPDRTVIFALWTAEERGLLGSEAYAGRPVLPIEKTVANFTMDVLQTAGPAHDVVLVGAGQNSLEKDLAAAAARQGRSVTPDSHPEKGLFYRADHFSLAKRGVPTLLIMALGGGADLVQGGREAGTRWVESYTANCYHMPCDAWSAEWDLRGAAQDVALLYEIGSSLALSRNWPTWNAGSEFLPIRKHSDGWRQP